MAAETIFTQIPEEQWLWSSKYFFIMKDKFPVSSGHLLIISKRPCRDYFELNEEEMTELPLVIVKAKEIIEKDRKPGGYNIGMNCGAAAGQTVFHFHCHVIPRYEGDVENPRGGIRNVIPGMGDY